MEDEHTFLKYLIDEEIYVIREEPKTGPEAVEKPVIKPSVKKQIIAFNHVTALMLDYSSEAEVPEDIGELLSKILGSVGLDNHKVERIYLDRLSGLQSDGFRDCTILAFLQELPVHLAACFDPQRYRIKSHVTNQFVLCDTLDKIQENRNLKRKLWEVLKKLYAVIP